MPAVEELEELIASLGIGFWTTLADSRDSVMLSMLEALREGEGLRNACGRCLVLYRLRVMGRRVAVVQ
ncbi:MAG: hypothetical protein PHU43_00925 [Candidatus Bipolaricaulis sp.]|nr:hypothetical protein [Candidatus Bipolaricaulis sp.]